MVEADGRPQAAFVDYGSAFAHYPTQLLTADCQVAVTGSGHSLSAPALEMTRALLGDWFSEELERNILMTLSGADSMTVAALTARLTEEGYPEVQITSEIGRLAKYGFISAVETGQPRDAARAKAFRQPVLK